METPISPSFDKFLSDTIHDTWVNQTDNAFIEALKVQCEIITDEVIRIGDQAAEAIHAKENPLGEKALFEYLSINFIWSDYAKSFLILWRDILFEYQKAFLLKTENRISSSALATLKAASKNRTLGAIEEWRSGVEREQQQIRTSKAGETGQLYEWGLQTNPWPVYRKQLERIPIQCTDLANQHQQLTEFSDGFQQIHSLIGQTLTIIQEESVRNESLATQTHSFINENIEERHAKIISHLVDQEKQIKKRNLPELFTHSLDKKLNLLENKTQVAIATMDGLLQYKELNFQRNAQQWLESEILPLLNESWAAVEQLSLNLKMALLNIRNRVTLLQDEEAEENKAELVKRDLDQPLQNFLEKVEIEKKELSELKEKIEEELKTNFRLSEIYEPMRAFLPVPLQSTINQFRFGQNELFVKARDWWNRQIGRVQQLRTSVELEDALSVSEKVARLIQSRKPKDDNNHYNSIFLTKGQIGKSFWVGRSMQLERIKTLYDQWKSGYRGAVMLTGQRFSGKTLFGELVAHQYFDEKTIKLSPNTAFSIEGRSMTSEFDLSPCLEFIQRHSLNERPMVWIDDIELWQTANIPLNQNIRALQKYIDLYSERIFFMVSTSNWSRTHLQKVSTIGNTFQAEINLDNMDPNEIAQAILLRHGATHKTLVNKDGEEVIAPQFKKLIGRTIKITEGNIGEALNSWACNTEKAKENSICYQAIPVYPFPDFLNPDAALLLTAIMMGKKMNEYRLRKLFGKPFTGKYTSSLQRLIRTGVLTRHMEGQLEVNDKIVNEIGKLLEQKKYLKFYH